MSATRSIPLTALALALAVGLMAHGTTSAQDHSQHRMPAVQDHSQHQPAKKPAARKPVTKTKAKARVAAKPASSSHAGHAGHATQSTPAAANPRPKAVAKPAKKKAATPPAPASHAGHHGAPAAKPASKPETTRQAADAHAGMDHDATAAPMTEMDHAAMGHTMPMAPAPAAGMDKDKEKDATVAPMAEMDHAAMGHAMPVAPAPAAEMDHAAMGHGTPVATDQPLTPIPVLTDADRAAAFPDLQLHMEHAPEVNSYVLFNRLEAWDADPGTGQAWEALAWVGTDLDRLWLRSEGERTGGHTEAADLEVLYGRSVSPWWDVVAGIRHDFQPGPSRTWAAFGVQGLSPYKFEVQATAYVGESGQTAANFEVEYETLLTNRLILQPLVEINLHGKDDPRRGIGSGLGTLEAGLRLRYEFTRRFAPYIGIVHERAYGGTADFRRAEGEDTSDTRVVAGVRIWF